MSERNVSVAHRDPGLLPEDWHRPRRLVGELRNPAYWLPTWHGRRAAVLDWLATNVRLYGSRLERWLLERR